MKKDYFNNNVSYFSLFMWKMETMHLDSKKTFQEEFVYRIKKINPKITKNKMYIINAIIFGEFITKKHISNFLNKDPGNISRSIDELISLKIIRSNKIDVEGKKKKVLSIQEQFYYKYIKIIDEYYERIYTKNFIFVIEEIYKQMQDEKMKNIAKILKKIKR